MIDANLDLVHAATTVAAGERVGVRIAPTIPYLDGDPEGNQEGSTAGPGAGQVHARVLQWCRPRRVHPPHAGVRDGPLTEALAVGSTVAGYRAAVSAAEAQFGRGPR